jgi:ribosomal protein S27E
MQSHQTVECPYCGKDSGQSLYASIFVAVKCIHCGKYLMYDTDKECSAKVSDKKK